MPELPRPQARQGRRLARDRGAAVGLLAVRHQVLLEALGIAHDEQVAAVLPVGGAGAQMRAGVSTSASSVSTIPPWMLFSIGTSP